eukprot:4917093-Pyramimonas_sp.AAC.1
MARTTTTTRLPQAKAASLASTGTLLQDLGTWLNGPGALGGSWFGTETSLVIKDQAVHSYCRCLQ